MARSGEGRGEPDEFGLTEQPAIDITRNRPPSPDEGGHEHGHEHGHGHDHENMVFSMFKRTPEGEIVEIAAQDIERDTSGYDEEGRDPGQGPDRPPPPDHGEHEHPHH